jgi:hypothetical protein
VSVCVTTLLPMADHWRWQSACAVYSCIHDVACWRLSALQLLCCRCGKRGAGFPAEPAAYDHLCCCAAVLALQGIPLAHGYLLCSRPGRSAIRSDPVHHYSADMWCCGGREQLYPSSSRNKYVMRDDMVWCSGDYCQCLATSARHCYSTAAAEKGSQTCGIHAPDY